MTLTFDLWPWPFAWTSLLSLVITPENFMMIWWWEHSQKGVTDRQTDGRTDGQTDGRTEPFIELLGHDHVATCDSSILPHCSQRNAMVAKNFDGHQFCSSPLMCSSSKFCFVHDLMPGWKPPILSSYQWQWHHNWDPSAPMSSKDQVSLIFNIGFIMVHGHNEGHIALIAGTALHYYSLVQNKIW